MIHAVLMDMDGVLVDSERFILESAIEMFRRRGLSVKPEDFRDFVGAGEDRFLGGVAEKHHHRIDLDKAKATTYEIYQEKIRGKLSPLPGATRFIERCRSRGLSLAIVTSADTVKLQANLKEIGLATSTFDVIVDGLAVARKKPFPDIYLRAAILLGASPTACLVVEDAVNGIKAGIAAGGRCLGITGSFERDDLISAGAEWVVDSLSDVPEEALSW